MIKNCPAWATIKSDDLATKRELLKSLKELARHDTQTLRAAVEQIVKEHGSTAESSLDDMSRIFVLNRYVFDVPSSSNFDDARFFGGWRGVPEDGAEVNLLWPLSIEGDKVDVVGDFGGFMGEEFQAIEEFDHFNQRFGRRQHRP